MVYTGGPVGNLLVNDCVGCHTSTTNQTIITSGGTTTPIVFNTIVPANPLAGGNFYWVVNNGDAYGHNVYGISGTDAQLGTAPGFTPGACGSTRCHTTLAAAPMGTNWYRGGCRGCHVFTYHHEDNGVFRFLKSHGASIGSTLGEFRKNIASYPDYVKGVEDGDWEQETATDHNYYKGVTAAYSNDGNALTNQQTVTAFCSGCHGVFHGPQSGTAGMGSASPWIRHPTDFALPETGEYASYNPVVSYKNSAPVAWIDQAAPDRTEAVVMCLSCHRAHGSDQPDMLRWNYSLITTDTTGAGAGNGCFICHTLRDGV